MKKIKQTIAMLLVTMLTVMTIATLPTAVVATSEEQELTITLTANVTKNEVVYTGQIVKFVAKVKNTGITSKNNVTVTIPVPEGTNYVEYDSTTQTYEEKEEREVKITLGTLASGKTASCSFELKMLETTLGTFESQVSVTAEGMENSILSEEYTLNKKQAQMIITNTIPTDPNYPVSKGNILYSTTMLEPMENLSNVIVTIEIPQGITIKNAYYQNSQANQTKNGVSISNNKVTVTIPSLQVGYIQAVRLELQIGNLQGNFSYVAQATAEGMPVHTSNMLQYTVADSNFTITQTSSNTKIIKETEQITYQFTIQNIGDSDANRVVFEDILPEELSFEKLQYIYEGQTTEIISSFHNTAKVTWPTFKKGETSTVTIIATANLLETQTQKQVNNTATIKASGLEKITSNSITNIIQTNQTIYARHENSNTSNNEQAIITQATSNNSNIVTQNNTNTISTNNNQNSQVQQEKKFDLSLKQTIQKITLTTPTIGTQVTNYRNKNIAIVDVLGENVNKSNVVIEYKIVITNEGTVPGTVNKIVDYLPQDTKFTSELNPDWYVSTDNKAIYNTSLENKIINPGQSKELTLILSITITDKVIGTTVKNTAEIMEINNEYGLQDFDSKGGNQNEKEDDMAATEIILSIVTGKM